MDIKVSISIHWNGSLDAAFSLQDDSSRQRDRLRKIYIQHPGRQHNPHVPKTTMRGIVVVSLRATQNAIGVNIAGNMTDHPGVGAKFVGWQQYAPLVPHLFIHHRQNNVARPA